MKITKGKIVWILFITACLLRYFLDRIGLGGIGAFLLLIIFVVFLFLNEFYVYRKPLVFLSLMILFFLPQPFYVGFSFGEFFYPFKPILRYLSYLLVYIMARHFFKSTDIFKLFIALMLVESIILIFQKLGLGIERPWGTLQNNNHMMYLLVLLFSLFLIWKKKWTYALMCFLLAAFLGGIGGTLVIFLVFATRTFLLGNFKTKLFFILAAPIFLAFGYLFLGHRIAELQDVTSVEERLETGKAGGGSSLVWRLITWYQHYQHIIDEDKIISGFGIDYASLTSPYSTPISITDPHNDYLLLLIDFGLIGLVLYILILFNLGKRTYFDYKKTGNLLSLALCICLIGLSIGSIVGNILTQSTLWWIFYALLGSNHKEILNERNAKNCISNSC